MDWEPSTTPASLSRSTRTAEGAQRAMDAIVRSPEAGERGRQMAIRERGGALRTECCPGGNAEIVTVRERKLRRATQAEHGQAAVARDEADGEHAAGHCPLFPVGSRAGSAGSADAHLMRKWWNL